MRKQLRGRELFVLLPIQNRGWGEKGSESLFPACFAFCASSNHSTVFSFFELGMSNPTYDPQTLDNYEPFHKEFGKKEFAIMGAFTAVFAPFGYFIGESFVPLLIRS